MARIGAIVGVLLLLGIGVAVAAKIVYPSATLRYKITVDIDTPEGVRTGSAVREVFIQRQPELPESGPDIKPKGEAVVIDLGKRGIVFALTSFDDYRTIFQAFPSSYGGLTAEGLKYYSSLKNAKAALKPDQYPMFVTFRDINDPKTVVNLQEVSGCYEKDKNGTCIKEGFHITNDRFEELFGKGVAVKDVTIEMTDEPVTWGIEKNLLWLPSRKNIRGSIGGSPDKPFEDPTKTYLTGFEFSQGKFWQ